MTTNPHVIFQYFDTSDYKQHSKAEMKLKILLFLFSYAPINPSWASIKHHTLEAPSDPGPSASCIYTLRIPTDLPGMTQNEFVLLELPRLAHALNTDGDTSQTPHTLD